MNNWISVKDGKPPKKGRDILYWFYSRKNDSVTIGYGDTTYGYFDMGGTGIGFSHWEPVLPPDPPKQENQ